MQATTPARAHIAKKVLTMKGSHRRAKYIGRRGKLASLPDDNSQGVGEAVPRSWQPECAGSDSLLSKFAGCPEAGDNSRLLATCSRLPPTGNSQVVSAGESSCNAGLQGRT